MKVCSCETWNLLHWVKSPAPLAISDIAHYFQKKSVRKVYRHIYLAIQLNEVNFSYILYQNKKIPQMWNCLQITCVIVENTWGERIHSVQSSIVSYTIHHEEIQCQVVVYQSTIITNNAAKGVSSAIAASISRQSSLLPVDDFQSRFLQLVKSDLKTKR